MPKASTKTTPHDNGDWRVVGDNRGHIVTDDEWRAWLAAGCPRDDVRAERDSDYKPTASSGGTKVRPPYHAITDNGNSECAKCGRPLVKSATTRSGLKHRDGWAV